MNPEIQNPKGRLNELGILITYSTIMVLEAIFKV